jgi:hypothetical protein
MATAAVKTRPTGTTKKQSGTATYQEPKRLSKAGQWLRDNPGGILEYVDWRAVNK